MALILLALALVIFSPAIATDAGCERKEKGDLTTTIHSLPNTTCDYYFYWRDGAGAQISIDIDGWAHRGVVYELDTYIRLQPLLQRTDTYVYGPFYRPPTIVSAVSYWGNEIVVLTISNHPERLVSIINVTVTVTVSNVTIGQTIKYGGSVVTGKQPIVITDELEYGVTYTYGATSNLVVCAAAPAGFDLSYYDYVILYEGVPPNTKLIGSMHYLLNTQIGYFSKGNNITLISMREPKHLGKIIINSEENLGNFHTDEVKCAFSFYNKTSSDEQYINVDLMTARTGQLSQIISYSSIVGFGQDDYPIITRVNFDLDASELKIYEGLPMEKMSENYIGSIYNTTSMDDYGILLTPLPLKFSSITLIVNHGTAFVGYRSALNPP